jgi:5'-deoxynucleotidase YfbR-like HD superfamily hydrolase
MATKPEKADHEFLFSIPHVSDGLSEGARTAIQMGALASRQVRIERTRCFHPDGRAENVAEHSLMLTKVAPELASLLYPELDANLVARFASLHDDIEAYVGDTPTDMLADLDVLAKVDRESEGLQQLAKEYAHMPKFVQLMTQYEEQSVPEARFVRGVDKLMVLLIHLPNLGATLREHYTYESFLESERALLARDAHKYGEFDKVMELRRELGQEVADKYLRGVASSAESPK